MADGIGSIRLETLGRDAAPAVQYSDIPATFWDTHADRTEQPGTIVHREKGHVTVELDEDQLLALWRRALRFATRDETSPDGRRTKAIATCHRLHKATQKTLRELELERAGRS